MLKLDRGGSNFSVPSVTYGCTRKKRETQKRKGVHFDEELHVVNSEPCTMSTSSFLRRKGMPWNSLAKAFDCEEDLEKDNAVLMNELLNLCSFWAEKESVFEGVLDKSSEGDDSDDDEAFNQHIARQTFCDNSRCFSACSTSSTTNISSLRFTNRLRIDSQLINQSSLDSSNSISCELESPLPNKRSPERQQSSTTQKRLTSSDELERAFKGVVDDNDVSYSSTQDNNTTNVDFWSEVEF